MGDRQNGNKPDGRGAVITQRKVLNMLRKTLTIVAAMAAIGAGTVGVANAATPAPTKLATCTATLSVDCIGTGTHLPGLGGLGLGGLFGGGHGHPGFPGGNFGHGFGGGFGNGFGGNFGGTFWQRDGVILPYNQVVSSCGCSGSPVSLGYTEVVDPQQVLVVPEGAVVTGDGSCQSLTSVNWGLPGWGRGVRLFHGHR